MTTDPTAPLEPTYETIADYYACLIEIQQRRLDGKDTTDLCWRVQQFMARGINRETLTPDLLNSLAEWERCAVTSQLLRLNDLSIEIENIEERTGEKL